jgi:hypothetical protein
MAKVPYSPVAETTPVGGATPKISPETPPGAFGENVGQALTGFGRQMERSSDEIFARAMALQQIQEEADARDKETQFMIRSAELVNTYKTKLGKDAIDGHPDFMRDYQRLRDEIRGTLKSDFARRMYDRDTLHTLGRTIFATNEHSIRQQRQYDLDTLDAKGKTIQRNAGASVQTPDQLDQSSRDLDATITDSGARQGKSPESIELERRQAQSELYFNQAKAMVREKPFEADKFVRDAIAAGILWGDHAINATNLVRTNMNQVGARNLANEVRSDRRFTDRPIEEQVDEGRRRAEELSPGNGDLALQVEQRIHAQYNLARAEKRDRHERNMINLRAGVHGETTDGRIPTTVDELLSLNPQLEEAWHAVEPQDRARLRRDMAQNSKGDTSLTTAGLVRYQELKGMASDPRQRAEFMKVETTSEMTIPIALRKELGNLQLKLREGAEISPQVNKAMMDHQAMLSAANITNESNPRKYNQFRGQLQDQIEIFQRRETRNPSYDETRLMVSRLLTDRPSQWWHGLFGAPRQFELTPPNESERDRIREQLRSEGLNPSEAEINRRYSTDQYQRTLNPPRPKTAPKPAQKPRAPKSQ